MHENRRPASPKRKRKTTCCFSEQIRNVDYKIYPDKKQDHLGKHKAMHRVSGKPDATLWITEFQAYPSEQFSSTMNNFFKTRIKPGISTSSAKHRKKFSKIWTRRRSSNCVRILRNFNVLIATHLPNEIGIIFVVAG